MTSRLNFVVFGATGFTGKYTVEEVHRVAKDDKNITWGIAGRSQAKLEKIIKDLEKKTNDDLKSIKLIVADVSDETSLKEMTKQADVIINCCGPYRFYGEPVVKACIETKTHHVDVSGEPAYMEKMQLLYNEAAEKAGVYIVSACGFDSIPTDLGVSFLESNFKGKVNTAESFVNTEVGKKCFGQSVIHYGTWESLIYGMGNYKDLGSIRRQLYPEKLPQFLPKLKTRWLIHKGDDDNTWYLPFLGSDKPCVYRSQRFFYEQDKKRPVQMNAFIGFPSFFAAIMTVTALTFYWFMSKCKLGRKILLDYPKLMSFGLVSHEGPSEELMQASKFSVTIKGEGWDESEENVDGKPTTKTMKVKVSGVNPGYGATCTALVYAAHTILRESDKMPKNGGVLAPAAAFSKTSIIEKLNANNLTFEVIN